MNYGHLVQLARMLEAQEGPQAMPVGDVVPFPIAPGGNPPGYRTPLNWRAIMDRQMGGNKTPPITPIYPQGGEVVPFGRKE